MPESAAPASLSLRRRLLIWLIGATAVIGLFALIDTRAEAIRTSEMVSDRVLAGSAMAIAEGVSLDASGGLTVAIRFSALDMLSSTAQDQVFYRVDGPKGFLTGYQALTPVQGVIQNTRETGFADDQFQGTRIRKATIRRELTTAEGPLPVLVTVAESTRARDQLAASILSRSALRLAGMIAGAALAVWAAITLGLRPLNRISQRMAERQPQDLHPIEGPAPQEMQPVLAAMNGFLERLQMAMSALANFSGNANHQIRTPLTVARTQIGLAQRQGLNGGAALALTKADAALIRTERVLEQLLLLARIEGSGQRPGLLPCDVAALAREVVQDELPQALQLGQDLGLDVQGAAWAMTAEVLLGELLRNLVSNALCHCPAGTVVTIEIRREEEALRIAVVDDGPALPDAIFRQLQERLLPRGPKDRRLEGVHGLGLHIVREIATALGTGIQLERGPHGQGLHFSLNLPPVAE